jgi:Immunity protein 52
MNERPFIFGIYYGLPRRRETPAVIGAKFLDSLDALSRIDPLFADWKVLDLPAMASLPLAVARPRIATIVENNVVRNKSNQPEPESGYGAIGVTANIIPSRIVKLSVGAGGVFRDEMMLNVGDFLYPTDPLIVKYGLFREALLATSAIWQPTWASVAAFTGGYWKEPIVPGAPLFPYSAFHIPWIAYLSPARTVRFPLPGDIRTERAADGGLLFTVTEESLDPTNPEHLHHAHILADTMIAHAGYKSS